MSETELGKLVLTAKGEDRSLRAYSRASGVDASIISKIIKGAYIPKSNKMLRALTSPEAAPRGGVTFEKLAEAANESKSFAKGMAAGIGGIIGILGAAPSDGLVSSMPVGGLPLGGLALGVSVLPMVLSNVLKDREENKDKYDKIEKAMRHFVASAKGMLFESLMINGIKFRTADENKDSENDFDLFLSLENMSIINYVLKFAFIPQENQGMDLIVKEIPKRLMKQLFFMEPSNTKKVSIVTNCQEAFNYMVSLKGKNSYNGELSVILFDEEETKLVREEYISHFVGDGKADEFYVV